MDLSDILLLAVILVLIFLGSAALLDWYRPDLTLKVGYLKFRALFAVVLAVVPALIFALWASLTAADAEANGEDFNPAAYVIVGAAIASSLLVGAAIGIFIAVRRLRQ